MRKIVFRQLLHTLSRHTPRWMASAEIQILLNTTARAFRVKGKRVWNHSPKRALREYADFTLSCLQDIQTRPVNPARLYAQAFRTGRMIRHITGFRSRQDIENLVFYLYRSIGIRMDGRIPGELEISKCYFSRFYSPEQCALMSSVDAGIIAGIAGEGRLDFTERLTEGCDRCRAIFLHQHIS